MPLIEFVTNLSSDKYPDGFHERAAHKMAEIMDKPFNGITLVLRHENMFRMGSAEPCMMIYGVCIDGFLDHDLNRKYTKEIIDFATKEFPDIQPARINFLMRTESPWQFGYYDGSLLGDRRKKAK